MFIYKTTNIITGKIYIGKSQIDNKNYLGSGIYLKRAIKKYGRENFKREIIEEGIGDSQILCKKEIYYIKFFNTRNIKIGYNLSKGGDGHNIKHSKKTKEKLSNIKKELLSNKKNHPLYGKHHSIETIKKLSIANKGRKHTKIETDKMSVAQKGRKHSTETKIKISKSNKGRIFSETHKKNISENHANMKGENNPMYGKSIYSKWLEKFGKEIAEQKYKDWVKKLGIKSKESWEKRKNEKYRK